MNRGPTLYKSVALPTELKWQIYILLFKNLLPKPVLKYFSLSIAFSLLMQASYIPADIFYKDGGLAGVLKNLPSLDEIIKFQELFS